MQHPCITKLLEILGRQGIYLRIIKTIQLAHGQHHPKWKEFQCIFTKIRAMIPVQYRCEFLATAIDQLRR